MCPKRLTARRTRFQANLKVSYRENTNTSVPSLEDCTELTWLALWMKSNPQKHAPHYRGCRKLPSELTCILLPWLACSLLKDKLAVVSDILNEGHLTGLQPRPPCIPPILATFHSSLPSSGVRYKWFCKDLVPFSTYHGEKTCNLCCSCLVQTSSEYIHTVWA